MQVFLQVLEQLMKEIEQRLGPLLRESLQPQSGLHVFSFLANSILATADEALAESLPGAAAHRLVGLDPHTLFEMT